MGIRKGKRHDSQAGPKSRGIPMPSCLHTAFTAACPCSGTYGTVFKAKNRDTHEIVALKRVRLDDDDEVSLSTLHLCGT